MSTNYTAYTIIGSLVDEQDFWVKTERSVHEACRDIGPGMYCSSCGKSIHAVRVDCRPIDGYEDVNAPDIMHDGRIYGLDVLKACTAEGDRWFVIGAIGECDDHDYGDGSVVSQMLFGSPMVVKAEANVRDALEKAGLWDPEKFGIWTVLHCSY